MPRQAADSTVYSALGKSRHQWAPGFRKLPWPGLGALILAVIGVAVADIILIVSDGEEVGHWKFQPTVYISIASTITNITLAYALVEGVSISWWSKAMKDGTTVGDLHRTWDFGTSFISAVLCGRHINLTAIASILTALSPINGPLLQRATDIRQSPVSSTQSLQVNVAKLVPAGYTGFSSSRANTVNFLTTDFSPIAKGYYNKAPISFPSKCAATCKAKVLGAGFHVNCSSYQAPYDANPIKNGSSSSYIFPDVTIFGANLNRLSSVAASLDIQYKPRAGCSGELIVKNCSLKAGTVMYDVIIDGPASTIGLAPGTTVWDDTVVGGPDVLPVEDSSGGTSTYGGLFLALQNQLDTNLVLQFGGGIGYEFFGAQSPASISYAHNITISEYCNTTFSDPTADFLQDARELMFRTAIGSANGTTDRQEISADGSGTHTVYHTNYTYVALATVASVVPIIAILLTFHGSQKLGRHVSLSPIETAKAFGAPILRSANSIASARALIKQVGRRPIKYGVLEHSRIPKKTVPPSHKSQGSESPYSYTGFDPTFSDAIPDDYDQSRQRQQQQDVFGHSDHFMSGANDPRNDHTLRQGAFTTGFESDMELIDPQHRSMALNTWLEIANPKEVGPIQDGMTFSNW